MSDRLTIRLTSMALATLMTWTLAMGIDAMAFDRHSGALQMSAAPAASQVAAAQRAPRS